MDRALAEVQLVGDRTVRLAPGDEAEDLDLAGGEPIGATGARIATTLDPDQLAHLPDAVREAFGAAVPPVFGFVAPLLGLAFVLAIALPAQPLRETAHVTSPRRRAR